MATISNPTLTVNTNRPSDQASVVVSCDIQFTEVEVNAMNMLGLQYTLHCQVLNTAPQGPLPFGWKGGLVLLARR